MIGAIAGDIIGSIYEHRPIKTKQFPLFHPQARFTDDSVLTVAIAKAILGDGDYLSAVHEMGRCYPNAGYGAAFYQWLAMDKPQPYNSWGNGAAMRVSPVGFAFQDEETVLKEAKRTAEITHNHPEGIKGAQATALAVFLARRTRDKTLIRSEISSRFGYDLTPSINAIRPTYGFDVSCQGTVPQATIAVLDSTDYEDAVRNAVSLGGDSDTLASISGGIAQAYYGALHPTIVEETMVRLPTDLADITMQFMNRFV